MQATAIVLADALATPVNHTFQPIGFDRNDNQFWFVDRSQANSIGYWRISCKIQTPKPAQPGQSSKDRVHIVTVSLHEPVLETVSNSTMSGIIPAPTVGYIMRSATTFWLPERGTDQNRKDLRKMMANLLANSNVVAVVENLEFLT